MKPGDEVKYRPYEGDTAFNYDNGIIKSLDGDYAFVVFHCGGEWDNYEFYTAQRTAIVDLLPGWVDSDFIRNERLALEEKIDQLHRELNGLKEKRKLYYHTQYHDGFDNVDFIHKDTIGMTPIKYSFCYPTQNMTGHCGQATFSVPVDVLSREEFDQWLTRLRDDAPLDMMDDIIGGL